MKKIYNIVLTVLSIIVLSWFLPWLYSILLPTAASDPFVAYSPINNKLILSELGNDDTRIYSVDSQGVPEDVSYTKEQRDSLLPQIYYTQLMARNELPDSIDGIELSVAAFKHNQWVFSSIPRDINKVLPRVYLIMESMPARIDLEDPKQVFRIHGNDVEFIDIATNTIDEGRSKRFTEVFNERGFVFPMQHFSANITSRKPYDEGYLITDVAGGLYHLKMRAGRPYMMKIPLPANVKAEYVFIMENPENSHLGLFTDTDNNLYIIEREGYNVVRLQVGKFDATREKISIMKNLFNWVVRISDAQGSRWTALSAADYSPLASYTRDYPESTASKSAKYIFPFELSFTNVADCYAVPRITDISWQALFLNLILAVIICFIYLCRRKYTKKCAAGASVTTLVFGIFAFIPFMVLKN
ncbi:MAG: DUF4857 domain-containing protein [Muribaculaceae bacterium]|nr:DUF4857 domain-containing protein [Muribaculaceae bacterium]